MTFYSIGDTAVCTICQHVIRLLRTGESQAPAVITLAADADRRSVDRFGVRFVIESVALPLAS
jgi:hypothetical protein